MAPLSLMLVGLVGSPPGKFRLVKPPLLQRLNPVSAFGKSVKYVPTMLPQALIPLKEFIGPAPPFRVTIETVVPLSIVDGLPMLMPLSLRPVRLLAPPVPKGKLYPPLAH